MEVIKEAHTQDSVRQSGSSQEKAASVEHGGNEGYSTMRMKQGVF